MNTLARSILETYLFEKKKLSPADIGEKSPVFKKKLPVFVTLYDGETIVASSGRIYPACETAQEELIENTMHLTEDPRFTEYVSHPEKIRKLSYRVDTYEEEDRRILHHPDDIHPGEGLIILCQKQGKAGIILPGMLPETMKGQEIYHTLCDKIDLDTMHLGRGDLILYAFTTEQYSDKS